MRDCHHNDLVGLRNRYLRDIGKEPCYDSKLVREIVLELASLIRDKIGGGLLQIPDLQEFYSSRTGNSKQRLGKAITSVIERGFDSSRDMRIKAFGKVECYEFDDEQEFDAIVKEPRLIMGRDPKFGLAYGRFTTALEKIIKHVPGFDKGDTYFDMGKFIESHPQEKFSYYFDDASKYEASQREKLLRDVELELWRSLLSSEDFNLLEDCFEHKMLKVGTTRNGINFEFYALRCSGEFDTLLGNTILNWVSHRYFEINNNLGPYDFVVTGDDGYGAMLHGTKVIDTFPEFGFECILNFVDDPTQLEFCSCKFVEYYPGKWMLCPNIPKLLRNIGLMKNVDFKDCIGHYYYSLGYMYRVCFPGFPFFSELSEFLTSITKNPKVKCVNVEHFKYLSPMQIEAFRSGKPNVVFSEKLFLVGIQMAYGLQRSDLNRVYDYFRRVEIDITGRDKRFNKTGSSAPEFNSMELDYVTETIARGLRRGRNVLARHVRRARLKAVG